MYIVSCKSVITSLPSILLDFILLCYFFKLIDFFYMTATCVLLSNWVNIPGPWPPLNTERSRLALFL